MKQEGQFFTSEEVAEKDLKELGKDTNTDIEAELNESNIDVSVKTNNAAGTNSIVLNSHLPAEKLIMNFT